MALPLSMAIAIASSVTPDRGLYTAIVGGFCVSALDRDVIVLRISDAFFFGAAATVAAALDRLAEHPKVYILDFAAVPLLDSTAAVSIASFAEKAHRTRTEVLICGASAPVRRTLLRHGVQRPFARYVAHLQDALASARAAKAG
ncbi:MAG: STAS domain-containing protein [Methylobacteriaceae bacterium]|nr:STAS domain-containing protein [Methylobacteriaceae bacterium]